MDKKKSESEIPPNIKRLVLHGWDVDPDADDDDDVGSAAAAGSADKKESPKISTAAGAGAGDVGAVADAYCVPGKGCRNRCGVCRSGREFCMASY